MTNLIRRSLLATAAFSALLVSGTVYGQGAADAFLQRGAKGDITQQGGARRLTGEATAELQKYIQGSDVKNVILLIGDGMGDSEITVARNVAEGAGGFFKGIDALPVTGQYTHYALDKKSGKLALAATPLFLALVVINLADLVFAVDSVPAIFAITTDTFIVYTSNIMAILGLRALYFALAAMVHRFHYLKYALALVLVFIGSKIFVADFLLGGAKFPPLISLGVTVALIAGGVLWSLVKTKDGDASAST